MHVEFGVAKLEGVAVGEVDLLVGVESVAVVDDTVLAAQVFEGEAYSSFLLDGGMFATHLHVDGHHLDIGTGGGTAVVFPSDGVVVGCELEGLEVGNAVAHGLEQQDGVFFLIADVGGVALEFRHEACRNGDHELVVAFGTEALFFGAYILLNERQRCPRGALGTFYRYFNCFAHEDFGFLSIIRNQ